MKRGLLAVLAAVFAVGVGTANAQFFVYDSENNDYVSANKNFNANPTSWQNYESAPLSGYTGPTFSYAGTDTGSNTLKIARIHSNDRFQLQDTEDFSYMLAFDVAPTKVKTLVVTGSTYGTGVDGDATYLLLHDSAETGSIADGWYATLLHDRTAVSTFDYTVDVSDATWYEFTPSTINGTMPLGTIGAPVASSIILSKSMDEIGYYAEVDANGANANHYLWTLAAYELAAELVMNPSDEVAMLVADASGTTTNTLSVSYTEGGAETNVSVTSVSIVNPSHSGFSVSPSSFTLTSPSPANEEVSVEFDNATAGLLPGQSATALIEVIWNEVGSATINTSSIPVSASFLIGDDSIIAAFYNTFTSADRKFAGVDAVISNGLGLNTSYGSTDTSYGTLAGGTPTTKKAVAASVNNPTVVVSVTNTTPDTEVFFDSLNFDVGRRWDTGPDRVIVSTTGDIENNASITNHLGFDVVPDVHSDFQDFDVDLTGLSDRSLTYGQSATFTFTFSDPVTATNPDGLTALDNIALLGSVISPTLFVTDPTDELALNVDEPDGVVTGAVAVSYIEASSMPTNVTVTAVSIVNQSHAGSFIDVSTNLPLTLTGSGISDDVLVGFNNQTAGLSVGQTATGIVEIVWNEVGSASSSTSSLPVSAMFLEVHPGNTIAIFDETFENAAPRLGGLVAQISGYYNTAGDRGSTDGTYGTKTGNARTDGGCYQATLSSPVITVAITNNTGYDCTFDSLHFDAAKGWAKGPGTVTVTFSGDIPAQTPFVTPTLPAFNGQAGDYPDFDIPLVGECTIAHGESVQIDFTFSNGDTSNTNAISILDNIALLGSGVNGAVLSKVPGGWVSMAISGLSLGASEDIEMIYTEGDAETNVLITGVSFTNETHPGAFSYTGSLPLELGTAGETNDIVTLVFDNTVANVPAGDYAHAVMQIAWNEKGVGTRTFEIDVYATRAADVPIDGIIALLDTEFLTADAAVEGVLARMNGGALQYEELGSNDGTYGSLATPAAPTGTSRWRVSGEELVATLSITNSSGADIELSTLNFDIGRWWESGSDEFTLSVSGDVTDTPALLVSSLSVMGWQNQDFDDHDVDLTGLPDHTLTAGESLTFTFALTPKAGSEGYNVWIDNIALMGTYDLYGGWANSYFLPAGQDGLYDNPDGDGKNNFMEYATGGNPMTADGSAAETWLVDDGFTTWFYHVHNERQDDKSLSYEVGLKEYLVHSPAWTNDGLTEVGAYIGPGLWKSVTNVTDIGTAEFIRLQVEQN